jgi:hypothetical protein
MIWGMNIIDLLLRLLLVLVVLVVIYTLARRGR